MSKTIKMSHEQQAAYIKEAAENAQALSLKSDDRATVDNIRRNMSGAVLGPGVPCGPVLSSGSGVIPRLRKEIQVIEAPTSTMTSPSTPQSPFEKRYK